MRKKYISIFTCLVSISMLFFFSQTSFAASKMDTSVNYHTTFNNKDNLAMPDGFEKKPIISNNQKNHKAELPKTGEKDRKYFILIGQVIVLIILFAKLISYENRREIDHV